MMGRILLFFFFMWKVCDVRCQSSNFTDMFKDCRMSASNFDSCMKDALNNARVFFKTGVPEYSILPFDPFYAAEVPQVRGGRNFNYKLKLLNVTESGWTISQVTRFRSDFNKNFIQYTQSFPEKALEGQYELVGNFLGMIMANSGNWNLTLYDLVQTTTVTRKPMHSTDGSMNYSTPLKVHVDVQRIGNMDLHISNLLGGRVIFAENILDRVINSAWEPGFVVIRPLINDLVSTAFTGIFNGAFTNFPFDKVIPA
ncbi:uncharacterized protein CBL_06209 [Carabus blaptoides fortunei]